jgi:hypothetical protein
MPDLLLALLKVILPTAANPSSDVCTTSEYPILAGFAVYLKASLQLPLTGLFAKYWMKYPQLLPCP